MGGVASAEPARWQPSLGGGGIMGHDLNADIDGAAARAGLEYRVNPAFGFGPELSLVQLGGVRDGTASTARGLAAIYVARWYALRSRLATLYLTFGFGGIAYSAPFPSGGTYLNGNSMFGAGLVLALGAAAALRLEARQVHTSNGRGIVPENPAYDGLELGVHLALTPLLPEASIERRVSADRSLVRLLRMELFLGARADGYSTIEAGGDAFGGVHGAFEVRLGDHLAVQLDGMGGAFSNDRIAYAAAARAYYRDERFAAGLIGGTTAIANQRSGDTIGAFVERYEGPMILARLTIGYEGKSDVDDLWFAEAMVHFYPSDRVLLRGGFSYAKSELKQTRADILMQAEYAPLTLGGATLGGYVQYGGNLFTRGSVGLVMYFDGGSYAHRERTRGVHGLRFK